MTPPTSSRSRSRAGRISTRPTSRPGPPRWSTSTPRESGRSTTSISRRRRRRHLRRLQHAVGQRRRPLRRLHRRGDRPDVQPGRYQQHDHQRLCPRHGRGDDHAGQRRRRRQRRRQRRLRRCQHQRRRLRGRLPERRLEPGRHRHQQRHRRVRPQPHDRRDQPGQRQHLERRQRRLRVIRPGPQRRRQPRRLPESRRRPPVDPRAQLRRGLRARPDDRRDNADQRQRGGHRQRPQQLLAAGRQRRRPLRRLRQLAIPRKVYVRDTQAGTTAWPASTSRAWPTPTGAT